MQTIYSFFLSCKLEVTVPLRLFKDGKISSLERQRKKAGIPRLNGSSTVLHDYHEIM